MESYLKLALKKIAAPVSFLLLSALSIITPPSQAQTKTPELSAVEIEKFITTVSAMAHRISDTPNVELYRLMQVGLISTNKMSRADYPSRAKIDWATAQQKAISNTSGSVLAMSLDSTEGYLCYVVEIVTPAKESKTVHVDALDGTIRLVTQDPAGYPHPL